MILPNEFLSGNGWNFSNEFPQVQFLRPNNFTNNLNIIIMETYNYLEAVKDDVKSYIDNEVELSDYSDREELESYLNDELFTNDSVTGCFVIETI